jgi:hypothetical protein
MKETQKQQRVEGDHIKCEKLINYLDMWPFFTDDDNVFLSLRRINMYLEKDLGVSVEVNDINLVEEVKNKLKSLPNDYFEGERRGLLNSMTRLNKRLSEFLDVKTPPLIKKKKKIVLKKE